MSQHSMIIADGDGASVLAALNAAFQAQASTNKGPTAPATAYVGQVWLDDNTPSSTVWSLFRYDGTDWIKLGELDTVNNVFNRQGTTTNDSPNTGMVGEYVSATLGSGAAVSLTSNTGANVASISLTAGDWDVWGIGYFKGANTTTVTTLQAEITTTSATISGTVGRYGNVAGGGGAIFNGGNILTVPAGPNRFSLPSTTTIYLVANALFGVSTCSGFGIIQARRVR